MTSGASVCSRGGWSKRACVSWRSRTATGISISTSAPLWRTIAAPTDQPIAGLLTDLQARGMLKDTLVVWAGEFGRTPHAQGGDGRDHNNKAFTIWMAGRRGKRRA